MRIDTVKLRHLTLQDEQEALIAHKELGRENFEFLNRYEFGMDWLTYLEMLDESQRSVLISNTRVPATLLVAKLEDQIVGRISIRHCLNDSLRQIGGHIGYVVRPNFRRMGIAGKMLDLALIEVKNLGINKALLTCDASNIPSRRIIESRGGIRDADVALGPGIDTKLRYWISTNLIY
jgi:predicted acetyltransferase